MYANCMSMPTPPPYYPWFGPPQSQQGMFDLPALREHIKQLKSWEEDLKGKKDDKKPEKKGPNASVVSMMLLMLLISPITGPMMFYFFQLSLGIIHK